MRAPSVGWWTTLGLTGADAYRPLFFLYAMIGLANVLLVTRLSEKVDLAQVEGERRFIGVHLAAPESRLRDGAG